MASNPNQGSPNYHAQPGLEVSPEWLRDSHSQLEHYVPDQTQHYPYDNGKELMAPPEKETAWPSDKQTAYTASPDAAPIQQDLLLPKSTNELPDGREVPGERRGPQRKKLFIIAGAILGLLIIVGAVIGGLFGAKVIGSGGGSKEGSSDSSSDNTSQTPTAAPTAEASLGIRRGSPLAVTGRKKGSGAEIYLFYQGPDEELRYSRYDSTRGSFGLSNTYWETPYKFKVADTSTRLAANTVVFNDTFDPVIQMYYTDSDDSVVGLDINEKLTPNIQSGSLDNQFKLQTIANGSIATYWPWLTYQDANGDLWEVENNITEWYGPSTSWNTRKMDVSPAKGSRLALVPLSYKFEHIAGGAYAIIYQKSDGKLAAEIPSLGSGKRPENYVDPWPAPKDMPTIQLSQGAPFAAFSVARPDDALGQVCSYLLYRDGTDINMAYVNEFSAWEMSKPAALKDVDPESDIACINMATSFYDADGASVDLGEASTETKCFFQRDGKVREVMLSGAEWVDQGSVPIP